MNTVLSPMILFAVLCAAPSAAGQATSVSPVPAIPTRGEAYCNRVGDPLKQHAYDFVPVPDVSGMFSSTDPTQGFFVLYSHRRAVSSEECKDGFGPENNSGIFLFDLGSNTVLIFGAGYGDTCPADWGADLDAVWTRYVIKKEFGYVPTSTHIRFLAPHGHIDHINPEYLRGLQSLGYVVDEIVYHKDDEDLTTPPGMSGCPQNPNYPDNLKISAMDFTGLPTPSPMTTTELQGMTYSGKFGSLSYAIGILPNPGHTCGTLDLMINVTGCGGRSLIAVRGANGNKGTVFQNLLFDIVPHGNVVLQRCSNLSCN